MFERSNRKGPILLHNNNHEGQVMKLQNKTLEMCRRTAGFPKVLLFSVRIESKKRKFAVL